MKKILLIVIALIVSLNASSQQTTLKQKTLVVWVTPFNQEQRGGSILTIDDNQTHFDGIIFGEIKDRCWMAGSDGLKRAQRDQNSLLEETSADRIQLAVTYDNGKITIYRNGDLYASYDSDNEQEFDETSVVVIGRRHLTQDDNSHFTGAVDDARIYDYALTKKEIAALTPNKIKGEKPWAWWNFENNADEITGRFKSVNLSPGAMVFGGALILDGVSAEMIATKDSSVKAEIRKGGNKDIVAVREFRDKLLADPYRPKFHYSIPEDYAMPFDPNGCIYWNGRYHMFYIFQEEGVHVFGHVSSIDMVNWAHHPKALYPTTDSPEQGIFSGNCFINKKGEATMLYHGLGAGNSISLSQDPLLEKWNKLPSNPIIPNPENGAGAAMNDDPDKIEVPYASWDPHGWLERDTYYAIFGGKRPALFRAKEIDKWEYVGDLFGSYLKDVDRKEDVSCPDFFTLGDKKVLLCISHHLGCRYYIGEWKDEKFYPESHSMMSFSDNSYFAPESIETPDGRRVMWAWIFDGRETNTIRESGWSGSMSMPRELFLREDKTMGMRPIRELRTLRYNEKSIKIGELNSERKLNNINGNVIELMVEIDPANTSKCGVKVLQSPDNSEYTSIYYDSQKKTINLDITKGSRTDSKIVTPIGNTLQKIESAPFELKDGEKLTLNIFIDKSIIEVYANERQAVVRTVYPTISDSKGVSVFSDGNSVFSNITSWDIMPSNEY